MPAETRRRGATLSLCLAGCLAAACGGRTRLDSEGGNPTGAAGAAGAGTSRNGGAAGSTGTHYSGTVTTSSGETNGCWTTATFRVGDPNESTGCPDGAPSAGDCCCEELVLPGLPIPGVATPHAGTITIAAERTSGVIATLEPTPPDDMLPGRYGSTDCVTWDPGDSLWVMATGGDVHAFSGVVRTPGEWTGLAPTMEAAPIVLDTSADFSVSWAPEGSGDATVSVEVWNLSMRCACVVPDSAGQATVDSRLLRWLLLEDEWSASGTLSMGRWYTSTATADNATIRLIGRHYASVEVAFE